ncbi:MAG: D-Ala-D-Ala carboxypeptidase family metallohydrolase [Chitinophagales bacterium]
MNHWNTLFAFLLIATLWACQEPPKNFVENIAENIEVHVSQTFLADAIPLQLSFHIRWSIVDTLLFHEQFDTTKTYNESILLPRTKELCTKITAAYRINDFKHSKKIQQFRADVASALLHHLSEEGTLIEEVQLTDIQFPPKFASFNQKVLPLPSNSNLPPPPIGVDELLVSQQERLKLQLTTLQMLVKAEKIAGEKFVLNSGYRDRVRNRMVGGVANSAHLRGLAMDISFNGTAQKKRILDALKKVGFQRIGVYYKHIHADNDHSLPTPARW